MEWLINLLIQEVWVKLGLPGGILLSGLLFVTWLYREERKDRRALQSDMKQISDQSMESIQKLREIVIEIRAKL